MASESGRPAHRRLPPFVGSAILCFAVMAGVRSFDLPLDDRWWWLVAGVAMLATASVLFRRGSRR